MSREVLEKAIKDKKLLCPKCNEPVQKFDRFVENQGVWDGAGDSSREESGSKVTLTCGNGTCAWSERTEYWDSFIED